MVVLLLRAVLMLVVEAAEVAVADAVVEDPVGDVDAEVLRMLLAPVVLLLLLLPLRLPLPLSQLLLPLLLLLLRRRCVINCRRRAVSLVREGARERDACCSRRELAWVPQWRRMCGNSLAGAYGGVARIDPVAVRRESGIKT